MYWDERLQKQGITNRALTEFDLRNMLESNVSLERAQYLEWLMSLGEEFKTLSQSKSLSSLDRLQKADSTHKSHKLALA